MGEGTGFNTEITNNLSTAYNKQKSFLVIEKDAFQDLYSRPHPHINIPGIITKNNRALLVLEVMGYLSTTYP